MNRVTWVIAVILMIAGIVPMGRLWGAGKTPADFRAEYNKGNYKDAYEGLAPKVISEAGTDDLVGDFNLCVSALENLGRVDEVDAFREKAIAGHGKDWKFLKNAAENYLNTQHYGVIIAGTFKRGSNRNGDGKWVDAFDRDRVRALQLMVQARGVITVDRAGGGNGDEVGQFYLSLGDMLMRGQQGADAWRLQTLTDLSVLPDYDPTMPYYYRGYDTGRGTPVDDKGEPVYHHVPKDWESAATDGERWRWTLAEAAKQSDALAAQVQVQLAGFFNQQFGVQTMASYSFLFRSTSDDDTKKDTSGAYAVYTLTDDETITKLASGIKRYKLPDEFNAIKIYEALSESKTAAATGYAEQAMDALGQIYEDRQQYSTAEAWWKKGIAQFGNGYDNVRLNRLKQVIDNWGMFESVLTQPAGDVGAKVDFRFRNATKVSFSATEIDVAQLLGDVKGYIKTKPNQLAWERVDLTNIGWRLVEENQTKYLIKKSTQTWDLDLKPRENHFDRRVTVETPLKKAGAYLLTATLPNGNISRIVVWVADTVIVRKTLSDGALTYVADASTGTPVEGAKVDFFGFRQEWVKDNRYQILIKEASDKTNKDGEVVTGANTVPSDYQWVTTATTKEGRLAFLGFTGLWYSGYSDAYDREYNQTKAFVMTDRPVYRPAQTVKWKIWVGQNKYDQDGKSPFAGQTHSVEIRSPKNDVVKTVSGTLDDFGGMSGEFELEKEATLGMYSINSASGWGGVSFRVEEYKKPEFEVKVDAPTDPVSLGEKVTATITAKYYFGAPVVNAKVKYTVKRTSHDSRWYPFAYWDWFYEPGYWWFAPDYYWYPGYLEWGCFRPVYHWWRGGWSPEQPELVSENEVRVGADGTVKVEIDTGPAKAAYGDTDHQYEITAEVTDASRRTIVGTGTVLVARKPFKVYAWTDQGYYQVGDSIQAHFMAQTLDNKPVGGTGLLKLLKVSYDEKAQPVETEVQRWSVNPREDGSLDQQINAKEAGQYRLSYSLTDAQNHTIEGGNVFLIRGEGFSGKEFRFNDIELITDKKEYKAGEKIKLMVNTNKADATVLLFIRPADGVYLAPKVLRLTGKSTVEEIEVGTKDMPNFFVEALTVADAHVYTEVREVFVPPADRVLNVAVTSDAKEYKPGQKAKLTVKVTEKNGEPFTGSAVIALYDKSVEYISGGSNVGDIRKYFWQWRRTHYVNTESSLERWSVNIVRSGETGMSFLGVFGQMATEFGKDKDSDDVHAIGDTRAMNGPRGGFGGGGGGRFEDSSGAMPVMAPSPMAAATDMPRDLAKTAEAYKSTTPGGGAPPVQPTLRTNFADTAYWEPSLVTATNGEASVDVTMPENLTTWKAKVWTLGAGTRVGEAETEVITTKKLIVRLEAPRFFVQTDQVVVSGIVHNYLKTKKIVHVQLELDGGALNAVTGSNTFNGALPQMDVEVAAGAEKRIDWLVNAAQEGTATVRVKAITDEESDATQQTFPVYVHGMLKTESFSGAIRSPKNSQALTVNVPHERRPEQTRLEIRYSPTLAGAMVDALPYLASYPYGCTEQTLDRFLPTVITQKILLDMKLDLGAIQAKRTNLNAQEIGDAQERAKGWKRFEDNPVFDSVEVQKMVREGVTSLTNMQLSDGGWGWFSGYGEYSYPHTTAFVVHGLQQAQANGAQVDQAVIDRGVQWLVNYETKRVEDIRAHRSEGAKADNVDAFVYMVLVDADHDNMAMRNYLYEDRNGLEIYTKAMFGLALYALKDKEKLDMILQNCKQYVVQDDEDQTAYLKMPNDYYWWYWYGSEFEAHAYYLKLLAKTDPKGETASRLAKYLINNRKNATYWNSTRDTAISIEALADYLRASGEDAPDMTVHVAVDGKNVKDVKITPADLFTFDGTVVLTGADVTDGEHKIEITRDGKGPLYFNAYLTNFTLEPHITHAGLEIKTMRKIYKLTEDNKTVKAEGSHGQAVDEKVQKYVRTELADGAHVTSGDLIEVELEVDSKNDYEYILLEDMKAAGFEPVEVQSGYNGNDMGAYVEFRDNRVCFFVRVLGRGKHSVSYRLRAEVPGSFSALPTKAEAMYAPELKANSDEIKLMILDAPNVIGN